jgi:hypothetical protein
MKDWLSRRVRFVKSTSDDDTKQRRASVELERAESGIYVGKVERPSLEMDAYRAGALAAADAVRQAAGVEDAEVALTDLSVVNVFGKNVVIVEVRAKVRGQERSLFGVCPVGDDPGESAALAVLSATNRMLDLA